MNGNTKTKDCHVIDLSKAPYTDYGVGPKRGKPKRCLSCGQLIKRGEAWRADTSAEDPEYGRYTVIHHSPTCPNPSARQKFQRLLFGDKRAA